MCLVVALLMCGCAEGAAAVAETAAATAPEPAPAPAPAPEPEPEPTSDPDRVITIAAAGDLVLNPHAMRSIEDDGEHGYRNLLAGYAASLREDEIAFLNLEQPLVGDLVPLDPGWPRQDTSRPRRSPILGATPPLADALAEAGVDVVSVANNHAYDQGRAGLGRTLEELSRVEVAAAGGGDDPYAPVVIERAGVRVAFVAFSGFFNQQPRGEGPSVARVDDERVAASLANARAHADLVVASVHWSRDFLAEARTAERRHAQRLVEQGADVILGTGPHVLHAVERLASPRGEALVAYSLGNVVSGMGRTYRVGRRPRHFIHPANVMPEARDGVILRATIRVESEISFERLDGVALWTENNWLAHQGHDAPHRIRVLPLSDVEDDVLRAERSPIIAAALGDAVSLR